MQNRHQHQQEVRVFLEQAFGSATWEFEMPQGRGHETYFARCEDRAYFVKLGVDIARSQAMAVLGLTPEVLAVGCLADGTLLLVQPFITGRNPARSDYCSFLEQVADMIQRMHHSPQLQGVLPPVTSQDYRAAGLTVLENTRLRWLRYRRLVPEVAEFVDASLETLERQVINFAGSGLVASHNDICNANWLVTPGGQWYLVDLEAMTLDDPALDIGATLWWYYPPALRPRFLEICGYARNKEFDLRMRVRMALHCLHILLPREQSFDRFIPAGFVQSLVDFRAALAGEENPQG